MSSYVRPTIPSQSANATGGPPRYDFSPAPTQSCWPGNGSSNPRPLPNLVPGAGRGYGRGMYGQMVRPVFPNAPRLPLPFPTRGQGRGRGQPMVGGLQHDEATEHQLQPKGRGTLLSAHEGRKRAVKVLAEQIIQACDSAPERKLTTPSIVESNFQIKCVVAMGKRGLNSLSIEQLGEVVDEIKKKVGGKLSGMDVDVIVKMAVEIADRRMKENSETK